MKFRILFIIVAGLLLSQFMASEAAAYQVKFCFYYETDYDDAGHGDYWTSNTPPNNEKPANGVKYEVKKNGNIVKEGFTNSSSNCTDEITLYSWYSYQIRMFAKAIRANNNYVYVKNSSDELYARTVDSDFTPDASETVDYVWTQSAQYVPNIIAAASFAINMKPAGLSDQNFLYYTDHCPDEEGLSCFLNFVYMALDDRDEKFTIIHETGHYISFKRNNNNSVDHDYGCNGDCEIWDEDTCSSHTDDHYLLGKEWQRAAATEGLAQFYAAAIWNDEDEYDCEFRENEDCEHDDCGYMESHCCEPFDHHAVEFDWLCQWWDVHTNPGLQLTMAEILDIWIGAVSNGWISNSDDCVWTDITASADNYIDLGIWEGLGEANQVDHGSDCQ